MCDYNVLYESSNKLGIYSYFFTVVLPVSGNMREVQGEQNGNKLIEIIHVGLNLQHE
jgi:hypothetical protein